MCGREEDEDEVASIRHGVVDADSKEIFLILCTGALRNDTASLNHINAHAGIARCRGLVVVGNESSPTMDEVALDCACARDSCSCPS